MVPLFRPCVKTERDYTFCESISHMSTSIDAIYKYRLDLSVNTARQSSSYIFEFLVIRTDQLHSEITMHLGAIAILFLKKYAEISC